MKSCTNRGCLQSNPQPFKDFSKSKSTKDGLQYQCKVCQKTSQSTYQKTLAAKSVQRTYYQNNKNKIRLKRQQRKPQITDYNLRRQYGISLTQYEQMSIDQEGRCLICRTSKHDLKKGLVVDHDHETSRVRGLLCNSCNRGLGFFKDSLTLLYNALNYLKIY